MASSFDNANAPGAVKLSPESMLLLEQSILRVPVECMRKVYRTTAKATEKDIASVEASLKKVTGRASSAAKKEDKLRAIEAALTKLNGVKRKLEEGQNSHKSLVSASRARITHLEQLDTLTSLGTRSYNSWAHLRLQRQLVDTLLRRGYAQSASLVARDEGLGGLVDVELNLFGEMQRIESALRNGSAVQALQWCKDNTSALKKAKSTLESDLRFQEVIELARRRQQTLAIQHCKKHLISPSMPSTSKAGQRVRQAMALLAFGPETTCPPYKLLYDPARWLALAATFRRAFLALYQLAPLPVLNLSMWAGLAALKLPACLAHDPTSRNPDCPTCDSALLGALARAPEVPAGHHANSIIVCRLTGRVLAGEDAAYALPNGMVYSADACLILANRGGGRIQCPKTLEVYEWRELKKVYIT